MRINILNLVVLMTVVVSCGPRKAEQFKALPFPDVIPPAMMEEAQDRVEYMAVNTWNRLLSPDRDYPSDSLLVSGVSKADVEQKFANWIQILDMADDKVAYRAIDILFDKVYACEKRDTSSNVFETFVGLVDKYMFDPNSPLRDEDYYGRFATHLSTCDVISSPMRDKYSYDAALCSLNKVGTKATDFRFADKRGKIYNLYGINAPYTLLFFSNPGCEACMNIINVLKEEARIAELISSGQMVVLNIYIDEDLDAWRSYMPIYPDEWYNGFDPDFAIRSETLYNVRAIPSLYLLDEQKTVLLKDAPENKLFEYLVRL